MKKLIKTLSLTVITALAVSCLALSGYASEPSSLSYDRNLTDREESDGCFCIAPAGWGDLNGDGKVTADDARTCLRASAHLDTLGETAAAAADIFGDGTVTAANARKILRVAAQLDIFDCYTVKISESEKVKAENLKSTGSLPYRWTYDISGKYGISVEQDCVEEEITDNCGNPITGGPVWNSFLFAPSSAGTYSVHMSYTWHAAEKPLAEFSFTIIVE